METIAGLGAALFVSGCGEKTASEAVETATRTSKLDADILAVAANKGPTELTRAAVDAIGGMGKLVKSGDVVVVKPNMSWNRPPDAAATTNPEVVAEVVKMCKEAGASKVILIDNVIDKPAEAVIAFSGIGPAGQKAGAVIIPAVNEADYRSINIPNGKILKKDTCAKEILKADVFINLPIAKSHSATKLTLGMKNLMGCNWDRQSWHTSSSLDQCIADYVTAVKPDLTIMDANRVLLTNGPKGPGETKDIGKVIACADPVAIDAYAATLFDLDPKDIGYIKIANEMGVGRMEFEKSTIKNV